jgi:hypothetical protein
MKESFILSQDQGNPEPDPKPASGPSSNVASIVQCPSRPLFVLLCVPRGWTELAALKYSIIEISETQHDDAFFEELRSHYRALRGFWHHWFDPRQFSFCHASRFERYGADRLGWWCNEMPPDEKIYEYIPRPAATPYKRLLPKHEWHERFYQVFRNQGLREAVEMMPKRNCRFQISTHVSREYMWGLHAQLRISDKMVFAWVLAITLGGWVFMAWWLRHHPGDLQNASVPITLIIGPLMFLRMRLNDKFKNGS